MVVNVGKVVMTRRRNSETVDSDDNEEPESPGTSADKCKPPGSKEAPSRVASKDKMTNLAPPLGPLGLTLTADIGHHIQLQPSEAGSEPSSNPSHPGQSKKSDAQAPTSPGGNAVNALHPRKGSKSKEGSKSKLSSIKELIDIAGGAPEEDDDDTGAPAPGFFSRKRWRRIVSSPIFNVGIGIVICVNTLIMGIELDINTAAAASDKMLSYVEYPDLPPEFFEVSEIFFTLVFAIEFLIRVHVYRWPLFKDPFTYIDLAALIPSILTIIAQSKDEVASNLVVLRIIKVLKICRLLRLIKMCRELYLLVSSFVSCFRSLFWVAFLLFMFLYCSAVFCTILVGQNDNFNADNEVMMLYTEAYDLKFYRDRYFGSVMRSVLTLFQVFSLDNWSHVVRPIVETHQPFMFLFFVAFIFITTFGLLNLLIGVIVDTTVNAAKNTDKEREKLLRKGSYKVAIAAAELFNMVDLDNNGSISAAELADFIFQNDVSVLREQLGEDLDIEEFFEICQIIAQDWMDPLSPCAQGLSMDEFVGAAIRLQGAARSRDVLAGRITMKAILVRVNRMEAMQQKTLLALEGRSEQPLGSAKLALDSKLEHPVGSAKFKSSPGAIYTGPCSVVNIASTPAQQVSSAPEGLETQTPPLEVPADILGSRNSNKSRGSKMLKDMQGLQRSATFSFSTPPTTPKRPSKTGAQVWGATASVVPTVQAVDPSAANTAHTDAQKNTEMINPETVQTPSHTANSLNESKVVSSTGDVGPTETTASSKPQLEVETSVTAKSDLEAVDRLVQMVNTKAGEGSQVESKIDIAPKTGKEQGVPELEDSTATQATPKAEATKYSASVVAVQELETLLSDVKRQLLEKIQDLSSADKLTAASGVAGTPSLRSKKGVKEALGDRSAAAHTPRSRSGEGTREAGVKKKDKSSIARGKSPAPQNYLTDGRQSPAPQRPDSRSDQIIRSDQSYRQYGIPMEQRYGWPHGAPHVPSPVREDVVFNGTPHVPGPVREDVVFNGEYYERIPHRAPSPTPMPQPLSDGYCHDCDGYFPQYVDQTQYVRSPREHRGDTQYPFARPPVPLPGRNPAGGFPAWQENEPPYQVPGFSHDGFPEASPTWRQQVQHVEQPSSHRMPYQGGREEFLA